MGRKDKDLFVLLKERMSKGRSKSGASGQASRGARKKQTSKGGIGDWFRSVLRITTPQPAGKNTPKSVPRGLLVPGWMPAVLLFAGLGAGFLVGRWTSPATPTENLEMRGASRGNELGAFPGGQDARRHRLAGKKAEERLSKYFIAVLEFAASQRDQAARLAEYLRERGLQKTRIHRVRNGSGDVVWMTLCYIDPTPGSEHQFSQAQASEVLERLRNTPEPDFAPEFAASVQRLGSLEQVVLEFR